MSCACFGGNGGGIGSCPCGADDEGLGHADDGDTEEGVCCTYGGDSEDVCSTCGGDGEDVCCTWGGDGEDVCCTYGGDAEDVCCTSSEDGEAVGGADVSFGALVFGDPSRDSLKLSPPSVKSKDGKNNYCYNFPVDSHIKGRGLLIQNF